MVGMVVFLSLLRPAWANRHRKPAAQPAKLEVSRIAYFAEALRLLESIGFKRRQTQTAQEFTKLTAQQLDAQSSEVDRTVPLTSTLSELTLAFYHDRFGSLSAESGSHSAGSVASNPQDAKIQAALARIRARVEQDQMVS